MIPVEIFTASQRLRGALDTRHHRVVDALNGLTESYVLLHNVEVTQLTGSLNAVQPLALVKLSKRAICFAVPQEVETDDPARRQARFFAYTPKDARPVLICLDNFELRGDIHVPKTASTSFAREALDLPGGEFVPVTGATVVFLLKPSIVFQAGVLLVNKAQVTVAGLLPPQAPA